MLEAFAPCVVLIDELVALHPPVPGGQVVLSGGTYDSNLSFVQALTEAVEARADRGRAGEPSGVGTASRRGARGSWRIEALEKTVRPGAGALEAGGHGRGVRDRPPAAVRADHRTCQARDAVCRAFADAYIAEGAKLPSETQEGPLLRPALTQAYPIHPEVFDRLYEDWSTIDGFQRTRGVLKLMAKVIARLWKADNKDLMILPGSLPLADGDVRNEMTYLLPPGWDPVIEGDIDGDRAETTELEGKEPRFGQVNAARRVARTLFLGTAPSSVATKPGHPRAGSRPGAARAACNRARRRRSTPTPWAGWRIGCTT